LRVLNTLKAVAGGWLGMQALGDAMAGDDTGIPPLKENTRSKAAGELVKLGLIDKRGSKGYGGGTEWSYPGEPEQNGEEPF
jgi:hypothetical protein